MQAKSLQTKSKVSGLDNISDMTNLNVFVYIKKATGEIVGKLPIPGKLSRGSLIENASVIVMILMNHK
jgi:hypothetical protein